MRDCTIGVAKTKALICVFVFAYAKHWFSHDAAHIKTRGVMHSKKPMHLSDCMNVQSLFPTLVIKVFRKHRSFVIQWIVCTLIRSFSSTELLCLHYKLNLLCDKTNDKRFAPSKELD